MLGHAQMRENCQMQLVIKDSHLQVDHEPKMGHVITCAPDATPAAQPHIEETPVHGSAGSSGMRMAGICHLTVGHA